MKMTKKGSEQQPIKFDNIEAGMIFEYSDETLALKLNDGEAVLLTEGYEDKVDWFEIASGYKTMDIKKIHGKLVEIVVE